MDPVGADTEVCSSAVASLFDSCFPHALKPTAWQVMTLLLRQG